MPKSCTGCTHKMRDQIERATLKGEPLRVIAERFSISKTALWRHKAHISAALAKSAEVAEMAHAGRLAEELRALIVDTHRMKRNAERKGDTRTALVAVRELCRLTELRAKLSGELNERAQHNELHVHLTPQRALAVASTYMARHGGGAAKALSLDAGEAPIANQSVIPPEGDGK